MEPETPPDDFNKPIAPLISVVQAPEEEQLLLYKAAREKVILHESINRMSEVRVTAQACI